MHLVMFDIDGTLVDSHGFEGELYARAIREVLGIDVDRTWRSYRHVTDNGIVSEVAAGLGLDVATSSAGVKQRFTELVTDHLDDPRNPLDEIPGARSLIDQLRSIRDVTLAIATGGWRETAVMKLSRAGIDIEGIPLATSSDADARTEIMQRAERMAGTAGPFERRTYFGDGPWDRESSAALGYAFIGVGPRVEHPVRFDDLRDSDAILRAIGVGRGDVLS